MHTINSVGDSIDVNTTAAFLSNLLDSEAIDKNTAYLIMAAISDQALRPSASRHER